MERRTKGAWLVHHSDKLTRVDGAGDFESIELAGRCGRLLSSLAANDQLKLERRTIEALSRALSINTKVALPGLLKTLSDRRLIDIGTNGDIEVLGLTTSAVLEHSADIFEQSSPSSLEHATLDIAELCSSQPVPEGSLLQLVSDTKKIASDAAADFLQTIEEVGFVDTSGEGTDKLYFNGHIFRKDPTKVHKALQALEAAEQTKLKEFEQHLKAAGCLQESKAKAILGEPLLKKLVGVGIFDVSSVKNDAEEASFITLPSAFSKYGHPLEDDALDLAKALVASLTYGMQRSSYGRGKISMVGRLLRKLNSGAHIGPATAIGEDYRVLELRRVVQIVPAGGTMFYMRLLKKEIGELAALVLQAQDSAGDALIQMQGASVVHFSGPEMNREKIRRKKQAPESARRTNDILKAIRIGR